MDVSDDGSTPVTGSEHDGKGTIVFALGTDNGRVNVVADVHSLQGFVTSETTLGHVTCSVADLDVLAWSSEELVGASDNEWAAHEVAGRLCGDNVELHPRAADFGAIGEATSTFCGIEVD